MSETYHDDEYNYQGDCPENIVKKFYRCSQLARTSEDLPRQSLQEWKQTVCDLTRQAFDGFELSPVDDAAFLKGLCHLPEPVLFEGSDPDLPDADVVLEVVGKIGHSGSTQ
jgi:hypothetical protein